MMRIGEILTESGVCNAEAVDAALHNQLIRGGKLGTNLLVLGLVSEEQLALALERRHGTTCLRGKIEIRPEVAAELEPELAARHDVVPYHASRRRLVVLTQEPGDLGALDELAFAVGRPVDGILVPQARLWSLLRSLYGIERGLRGAVAEVEVDEVAAPRVQHAARIGPHWHPRPRTPVPAPGRAAPVIRLQRDDAATPVPSSLGEALGAMESGRTDEVLRAILGFVGARYRRAVLMVVRPGKPGVAVGWEGTGQGLEPERVRRLAVALAPGNVIHQAVSYQAPVIGPLQPTLANERLVIDLGGDPPGSALAIPVMSRGQAVAVLYADDGPGRYIGPDVGEVLLLVGMAGRRLDGRAEDAAARAAVGSAWRGRRG